MKTKIARQQTCIVCGGSATLPLLTIDAVPVYCNVLHDTRERALHTAKGNIALRYCQHCDHLFNDSYDAELLRYTQRYDASLHYSSRFRAYAEEQADYLLRRYQLAGKRVLEIACGKGDFLGLLASKCDAEFIGFDPAFEKRDATTGGGTEKVTVINEYYDANVHHCAADLIICRQALEHVERPAAFLQRIAAHLPHDRQTQLFFEVPNSLFSLRDLSVWDFIYEHVSYFSQDSLKACFAKAGFAIVAARETYGGQYLCIECEYPRAAGEVARGSGAAQYVQRLASCYAEKVAYWNHQLRRDSLATVLWGAGSKGVTFLNVVPSAESIDYIVDLNPQKQNKYIPGTGQLVIQPEQVAELAVQRVLVMNPLYLHEIETMLTRMGIALQVTAV